MKKVALFLAFIGMLTLQGCTIHDQVPVYNTTVAYNDVLEVTTSFSASNNFSRLVTINPAIYSSDVVLVYHLYQVTSSGTDVWRLMPQTYYLDNAGSQVSYNFDFTRYDVSIFMNANIDMTMLTSEWTQNQTFRIVILPGTFNGKSSNTVDFKDYNATLKAYHIDPTNVKKIKM